MVNEILVERLRKRAEIRRQISSRRSVMEGKPDRLADLLDEAADVLDKKPMSLSQIEYAWLTSMAEPEWDARHYYTQGVRDAERFHKIK